jgi:hypothetical protein
VAGRFRRSRLTVAVVLVLLVVPVSTARGGGLTDITPPVGSVSIADGATYTSLPVVPVAVSATDDASGVATVELSNDGATWTSFPYAPVVNDWMLPVGPDTKVVNGTITVRARWTDGSGNTSAVSTDTIIGDSIQPTGTVDLVDYDSLQMTVAVTANDSSGIHGLQFSCDNLTTLVDRPMASTVTVPFSAMAGCDGFGWQTIWIVIVDRAGNNLPRTVSVDREPSVEFEYPLPAVTGQLFTIDPVLEADYTIPADAVCEWELRWGDAASLDDIGNVDETFGSLLLDGPASTGGCGPWTFTLPWVPVARFQFRWRLEQADGYPIVDRHVGFGGDPTINAQVSSTDRRIRTSNLPLVQILPSTYTPIVGSPVTYTAFPAGGAGFRSDDHWTAYSNGGAESKIGGSTFTITPTAPGSILVCFNAGPSRSYLLGACYDPPARYRDTARPNTTPPFERLGGAGIGPTTPVTMTWSGSDKGWDIAKYTLQRRTDAGAWHTLALPAARSTSIVQNLVTGHSYRYRVRAVDKAGNVGYWDYGPTFKPRVVNDTNRTITYRRTWSSVSDPAAIGGMIRRSATSGASATFIFTGRDLAWIADRGAKYGKARIYINGVLLTTVDLYASSTQSRRLVFRKHWSTSASRTVRIVGLATSTRPAIDVDAFLVLR